MRGLSRTARAVIRSYGISPEAYAAHLGLARALESGDFGGSLCGCPDDRCAGSHHEVGEQCGCVEVLAAEAAAARRV